MGKFLFSLVFFSAIAFGHTNTRFPREIDLLTTTEDPVTTAHNGNGNQVCTPNDIKMQVETNETCNRCKCAANGIGWFCTRIPCPPRSPAPLSNELHCTPGTSWKSDCNNCFCTPYGSTSCTQMACNMEIIGPLRTKPHATPRNEQHRAVRQTQQQCKPGDRWEQDCNTCHCTYNGVARCTMRSCPKLRTKRRVQNCTPGDSWKEDCNSCFCSSTGLAACTRMECIKFPEDLTRSKRQTQQCTPGDSWKEDCNSCFCTSTGLAACTLMECLRLPEGTTRSKRQSRDENRCTPGDRWQKDCNECFCTETGLAACTLKGCLGRSDRGHQNQGHHRLQHARANTSSPIPVISHEEFHSADFQCTPHEYFKVDCNNCKCGSDGKNARCTKKGCISTTHV